MKKLILAVVVMLLNATVVLAANRPVEDFPKVTKVITNFLNEMVVDSETINDATVKIIVTATTDNELVVLHVNSKNEAVKKAVKSVLNNRILEAGDLIAGKEYTLLVNIKGTK